MVHLSSGGGRLSPEGVKWYSVGISGESRFCLHAYNDCLQVQCKSREQYFPVHIHPWHTDPTPSIMEINIIMVLVFVKIILNSIIVQLTLLSFLQVEDNVLFYRIMPTHNSMFLNILCKIFDPFHNWTCSQLNRDGTWWDVMWLMQLAHLQLLLY